MEVRFYELRFIEFGRKQLLTIMSFIMSINLIVLGVFYFFIEDGIAYKYLIATLICTFVALFEFSLGPIPWLYMAEIMTDKGLSLGVLVNWLLTLFFAIVTPFLFKTTVGGGITFIVFGGFSFIVNILSGFEWGVANLTVPKFPLPIIFPIL